MQAPMMAEGAGCRRPATWVFWGWTVPGVRGATRPRCSRGRQETQRGLLEAHGLQPSETVNLRIRGSDRLEDKLRPQVVVVFGAVDSAGAIVEGKRRLKLEPARPVAEDEI